MGRSEAHAEYLASIEGFRNGESYHIPGGVCCAQGRKWLKSPKVLCFHRGNGFLDRVVLGGLFHVANPDALDEKSLDAFLAHVD